MFEHFQIALSSSTLFKGINENNMEHLLTCMKPVIKFYKRNEIAAIEGMALGGIGIVLSGAMNISKTSITGSRIILGTVWKGDLFGETAAFTKEKLWPATVESIEPSTVMFISPARITGQCSNACIWHRKLQENMLEILAEKALGLTKRIKYMAIKGLRSKICTYLYNLYLVQENKFVEVPLKKYELAELFNVERPSLSREMINLRSEGIIDFSGKTVKLVDLKKIVKIIED